MVIYSFPSLFESSHWLNRESNGKGECNKEGKEDLLLLSLVRQVDHQNELFAALSFKLARPVAEFLNRGY